MPGIYKGFFVLLAAFGMLALAKPTRADEAPALVFAASSFSDVLTEIAANYEAKTGHKVILSFAASSTLARQIEAGADAQIFISADRDWMDYLNARALIKNDSRRVIAGNSLVIVAPKGSDLAPNIDDSTYLAETLREGIRAGRLAIADTAVVPAGRYAKEALIALGLWQEVEPHLVLTENVRAALSLVGRGEAPLGIVYETDARADIRVRIVGLFPEDTHKRIVYPAVLTTKAGRGAAAFLDYLGSNEAQETLHLAGFVLPDKP